MFLTFGTPRDLNELAAIKSTVSSRRKEAEILIIDDLGFSYQDILMSHHFRIHTLPDIHDIRAVAEYHIIACDIKGVGKRFGSRYEGAHVIGEISKAYPEKILIGYSTHNFDASYNRYLKLCDSVVEKDIDSDAWINILDDATTKSVDPIFQWKRLRDLLLKKDVPLLTVLLLQEDFIRAVKNKNQKDFPSPGVLSKFAPDTKAVIDGFAGNLLFKVLIG